MIEQEVEAPVGVSDAARPHASHLERQPQCCAKTGSRYFSDLPLSGSNAQMLSSRRSKSLWTSSVGMLTIGLDESLQRGERYDPANQPFLTNWFCQLIQLVQTVLMIAA
jgi:hypothetical protein